MSQYKMLPKTHIPRIWLVQAKHPSHQVRSSTCSFEKSEEHLYKKIDQISQNKTASIKTHIQVSSTRLGKKKDHLLTEERRESWRTISIWETAPDSAFKLVCEAYIDKNLRLGKIIEEVNRRITASKKNHIEMLVKSLPQAMPPPQGQVDPNGA